MKHSILYIIICLVFFIVMPVFADEPGDPDVLHRLNIHLNKIAQTHKSGRIFGGGVSLGFSALYGIGLVVFLNWDTDSFEGENIIIVTQIGFCTYFGLAGGIMLAFPSKFETLPHNFNNLPEKTRDDITQKINTGEAYLNTLYHKAKMNKLITAGICASIGISSLLLSTQVSDSDRNIFGSSFWKNYGIMMLCYTIYPLFFQKTFVEKEYESYMEWKKSREEVDTKKSPLEVSLNHEAGRITICLSLKI